VVDNERRFWVDEFVSVAAFYREPRNADGSDGSFCMATTSLTTRGLQVGRRWTASVPSISMPVSTIRRSETFQPGRCGSTALSWSKLQSLQQRAGRTLMQMAGDIWVALLLGVTVVALVVGSVANRRVMSKHPEIWSQLGKPAVFNNSISNSLKSLKFFVLTSDYKRLEDDTLNRYVGISRSLNFMMVFLLVVGAICMFTGKFG
jgi:hypothetical protein